MSEQSFAEMIEQLRRGIESATKREVKAAAKEMQEIIQDPARGMTERQVARMVGKMLREALKEYG